MLTPPRLTVGRPGDRGLFAFHQRVVQGDFDEIGQSLHFITKIADRDNCHSDNQRQDDRIFNSGGTIRPTQEAAYFQQDSLGHDGWQTVKTKALSNLSAAHATVCLLVLRAFIPQPRLSFTLIQEAMTGLF